MGESLGVTYSRFTPVSHPGPGEDGHTARDWSSCATIVMTKLAYTIDVVFGVTTHSLQLSHSTMEG
jgi:hypothetical protein